MFSAIPMIQYISEIKSILKWEKITTGYDVKYMYLLSSFTQKSLIHKHR